MEDHRAHRVEDLLEIYFPSIWTFKIVGHTKFNVVFYENDSTSLLCVVAVIIF